MIRVILVNLLLFLLPFIVYAGFLWMTGRWSKPGAFGIVPVVVLILISMVMMTIVAVYFVEFQGAAPGTTFIAPYVDENGVLQPGRYE
ncbi:MAG: DUF6111 family protein [Pseudomonadota bacterium]